MKKYLYQIFDDIFKIKGYKSIDEIELTYQQGVILAKYVNMFSDHQQSLQCDITKCENGNWLCYFKYFRVYPKNKTIIIVYLDPHFTTIRECVDSTPFTFSFSEKILVN